MIDSTLLTYSKLCASQAHSALTSVKDIFARAFYHDSLPLAERKLLLNVRVVNLLLMKTAFSLNMTNFSLNVIFSNSSHYE